MTIKVVIFGLGIMGTRMISNMLLYNNHETGYLWDPDKFVWQKAAKLDRKSRIMGSASDAISKAELEYFPFPPAAREPYATGTAEAGKPLFLGKPFGINLADSESLLAKLKFYIFR